MPYFKTVTLEVTPNGKEYKLSKDMSLNNALIRSIRTRSKGYSKNGFKIAAEIFDSALLTIKVNGSDVIENLPLVVIEEIQKSIGKGLEVNLQNIDWSSSLITVQNGAAAVANTALELIFEYDYK
jgi:hypothetical protein